MAYPVRDCERGQTGGAAEAWRGVIFIIAVFCLLRFGAAGGFPFRPAAAW
jgi:hypothetical protein